MCRLYGFLANEKTRLECTLLRTQNALLKQSRSESLGQPNADGWEIAYSQNEIPNVGRHGSDRIAV